MIILALVLAVLIGVSLGLLGGGGSILTVPILVYVVGLEPRDAIATSLLVVGVTSAFSMLSHARAGRVQFRTGLLFGSASMAGAYAGGRLAHLLPAKTLLLAFTVMMFVTAIAMMRRRADTSEMGAPQALRGAALARASALGVGIGLVTGTIGAGGGFVVVPALVLLCGLPMRTAVGTSLLVIAMNSVAAFAGALAHATISWSVALAVTGASVLGSFGGVALAGRVKPQALRAGFAWFVLGMALWMSFEQLPPSARSSVLARSRSFLMAFPPVSALIGGALIGASASMMLGLNGRITGISGILGGLVRPQRGEVSWRATFLAGLIVGGILLALAYPGALPAASATPLALTVLAGLLVGFGTQLGGGCTSGHGVCGISRFSKRSILATMTFMVTGALATFVVQHVLAGPS